MKLHRRGAFRHPRDVAPLLKLYAFRFRDPATGKWTKARYKASVEDTRVRYTDWELLGEPELRGSTPASFSPFASRQLRPRVVEQQEQPLELQPHRARPIGIDRTEAVLTRLLLRRYVTYCARRRMYAAMNGAAALLREISQVMACRPDQTP